MRSRNFVIGLFSSVVVVAAALGLLLVLGGDVEGRDLELPETVGDLTATDLAAAFPEGAQVDQALERARTAARVDAEGLSEAYGAAAASRAYLRPGDDSTVYAVSAVRADAGPLVPEEGFVDPEVLGLALPQTERVTDGDVECLLRRNQPPRAGSDYQPDQAEPDALTCQRRSGSLTVRVRAATGDTDAVVALVDDLWSDLT